MFTITLEILQGTVPSPDGHLPWMVLPTILFPRPALLLMTVCCDCCVFTAAVVLTVLDI